TDLAKVGINCDVMERERKNLETERVELAAKLKTITSLIVSITEEESSLKETVEADEKRLAALQEEAGRKRNLFFDLKSRVDVVQEQIVNLEQRLEGYGRRKESLTQRKATLTGEIQTADTEKEELKKSIWSMGKKITALTEEKKEKENRLHGDQTGLKEMQAEIRSLEERLEKLRENVENLKEERRGWEVKKAEKDRDLVNLEEACWQELRKTLEEVKAEALAAAEEEGNEKLTLAEAREKLERIGSVNLMAEEEYTSQKKRYDFLIQERDDLTSSIASTREAIKKIDTESRTRFLKALEAVNTNFQEIFAVLFDGGKAEVKLSEPDDPLESGVDIVAQPPGKRGQSLNLLSGGEKSLTSLAFFFALFRYRPTPFCILDEVDAPLDEVNLGRFLNMMQKIKDTTQFIIVTHNFKTMEVADFIYGTTMAEPSVTSIYSVKLDPETKKLQRR
ncbi:MAG: chromosome segregation protein SMC, partial [Acidobacteria bacterium]|nr:chromosome segregation protein SMC [Acidobacteriota bacterium]